MTPDPPIQMFESPDIALIKDGFKEIIEHLDSVRRMTKDAEVARWASVAITQTEIASMCAIRALIGR